MRVCLIAVFCCVGCAATHHSAPPSTRAGAMAPVPVNESGPGFLGRTWNVVTGRTPIRAVRMMEDSRSADNRRKGICELAENEFARREPYTRRYRQIAQNDPDFTVRAAAIRALNWSRDMAAVPIFIAALKDANELVRWQAAKGLVNVPDESALGPLTRAVGDANESKNVRIAAADALRHYRNLGAARALVATLEGKDFGVAWQARKSLKHITGRDLRYDERAWLEYLTSAGKNLS